MACRKKTWKGLVVQLEKESCAGYDYSWVSSSQLKTGIFKVRLYSREDYNRSTITLKTFGSIQVHALLSKSDEVDSLIQSMYVMQRAWRFLGTQSDFEIIKSVANYIGRGNVIAGLVQLSGTSIQGQSVKYVPNRATISFMGISGAVVLIWLVAMPCIALFFYARHTPIDVIGLYNDAILNSNGSGNSTELTNAISEDLQGQHFNLKRNSTSP